MYEPLRHEDAEKKSDEQLAAEAEACLAGDKNRQFMVTVLTVAFEPNHPWLSYDLQKSEYPTYERFKNLEQRPDIRQEVTTKLTGLAKKTSRVKRLEVQAELIDETIANDDTTVAHAVEAFKRETLVTYGPNPRLWALFLGKFPWQDNAPAHVNVVATCLETLLHLQIMTHLRMRMLIDEHDWQTLIPLEKRIEVAKARYAHELTSPDTPFTARMEMEIVTPRIIAENIPLARLKQIFEEAEKLLDFALPPPPPPVVESSPEVMKAVDSLIADAEKKDDPPPAEGWEAKTDDKLAEAPTEPPTATSTDEKPVESTSTSDVTIDAEEVDASTLDLPKSDVPPPSAEPTSTAEMDKVFEEQMNGSKAEHTSSPPPSDEPKPEGSSRHNRPRPRLAGPPPLPKK